MNELLDPINSSSENKDASADFYLKLHQRINSKNEETQRSYKNNIVVKFTDIKELHLKTIQSISALGPDQSAIGVRINVVHNEGEADSFNSFDAFETHNITSPNPTSSISLIYTFVLIDTKSSSVEQYKIQNQISSRIAELKQIENEAPKFLPRELFASILTTTARIKVEYSDYVKARHFIAMFDEWIRGCDENRINRFVKVMQPNSYLISKLGVLLFQLVLAWTTICQIQSHGISQDQYVTFIVAYAFLFVAVGSISSLFLVRLERAIDGFLTLSYLEINKGDGKLIKEFTNRNKESVKLAVMNFSAAIFIGICSNFAYDSIKFVLR